MIPLLIGDEIDVTLADLARRCYVRAIRDERPDDAAAALKAMNTYLPQQRTTEGARQA